MSVGEICSRIVATASESETIRSAAERMGELDVGTLVVVGAGYPRSPSASSPTATSRCAALRKGSLTRPRSRRS